VKSRFLFILFVALVGSVQGACFERKAESQALTKNNRLIEQKNDGYSLHELLDNVPEAYVVHIQEAFGTLVSQQKLESLRFSPLIGGLSTSRLYRTEIDNKKCVLRLLDPKRAIEKRLSEIEGITIAARLKIGPNLIYANESALVVLVEYIEGRTFSHEDLNNSLLVKALMRSIRAFHNCAEEQHLFRAQVKKIDTIQARHERHVKEGAVYPSCYDGLFQELKRNFTNLSAKPCAIHGDFKPENVIIANDGRIYLIDCAEASVESPLYDIGWFSCFSGASSKQVHNLLHEYYGRKPSKAELREALLFKDFATFFLATAWIGRQEERNQDKLDALLKTSLEKGSSYIKRGVTTSQMTEKKGAEVTAYALGWLKDFIDDRYQKQPWQTQEIG
jgi:thiamine kinase-like enzyme